jgi:hypothetical protein
MLFPFSNTDLTTALLKVPYVAGQVGRLGLFAPRRLTTTTTMIEVKGQRLALLPDMPRGAPPTPNVEDRRFMVPFRIPHFPIRDTLYADAVQDVRLFGDPVASQGFNGAVQERIDSMGVKLDVTLEHLRLGAVKGIVITAVDRETGAPLRSIDLFSEFGVAQQATVDWPPRPPHGRRTARWHDHRDPRVLWREVLRCRHAASRTSCDVLSVGQRAADPVR